jgi:hypothetical protein
MVLGVKKQVRWEENPNRRPFAHYLGKGGTMTRAYGYIYTIFALEASHASLSGQALLQSLPGPDGRAQTRGSLMRTTGGGQPV